ncbi:MAG: SpoVR family protein [Syntrophomonadaceae bacterium]|nr:SpoVR family protein [Syntrophomonadaceae bacterium]
MGSDYTLRELQAYNERIEEIAAQMGLNCYPQEFEIITYEDMLACEAYMGMPVRYRHWSFGKSYERKKTFYHYNLTGLPYEMVINSNPCLAYLMKDNTLPLQVLTMAHVYGHNDFFKNNRMFTAGTRAENCLEMFKAHARRIGDYIMDPSIGYQRVERILDAAHALRFQVYRTVGERHLTPDEQKQSLIQQFEPGALEHPLLEPRIKREPPDLNRIPLEPEEDILLFIYRHGQLEEWERDVIGMIREESLYFLPQIETKIMNEGWASFWHYRILHELDLPQEMQLEFLKRHNQVLSPHEGSINPYHLGFKVFEKLEREHGRGFLMQVRESERDASFLRCYLDQELCRELNLFSYLKKGRDYFVSEVADEDGWKYIRDTLAGSSGIRSIPNIKVSEVRGRERTLLLEQEWDGRELLLDYAHQTIKYIARLWGARVRLRTMVRNTFQILETDGE